MRVKRILLADDHQLVRSGLRALLEPMSEAEVVGETGSGREAVKLVKTLRPDIVLMDIAMPDLNGLDATGRIVKAHPHVSVVMLSMHSDEEYVKRALLAGATGYLLKNSAPSELQFAIQAVSAGETWLSPPISRQLIDQYLKQGAERDGPFSKLTSRQREILQLIAEGKSTKHIASSLSVSVKTVETHRANLMDRLGIRDVPGLVRYAVRHGLVISDT